MRRRPDYIYYNIYLIFLKIKNIMKEKEAKEGLI